MASPCPPLPDSATPAQCFAQTISNGLTNVQTQAGIPERLQTIPNALATIYNTIIIAGVVIFMFMLIFGGIQYLTVSGNEEATAKARRLMIDAVIGLIVTLSAYAISTFVLRQFGLIT